MAYKILNEFKEETHPWKPYIPEGAKKLILGTFPTAENNRGAYDFFIPILIMIFGKFCLK